MLSGVDGNVFWGEKMEILVSTSHLLITFNCSCNFAIYCAKVRNKIYPALLNFACIFVFYRIQNSADCLLLSLPWASLAK